MRAVRGAGARNDGGRPPTVAPGWRQLGRATGAALTLVAAFATVVLAAVPAGPPFPEPEFDRAVYDQAGVFRSETIASAEATIDAIEARTGAEIVVYTQVVGYGISTSEAERHAIALMDQWGVGRAGFDDGLVILFDLDPSLLHGQVQLYAGPGFRRAYLSNDERQAIFQETMVPHLAAEDLDAALLAGLARIDARMSPDAAGTLGTARLIDAVLGLIVAPLVLVLVAGWGVRAWWREGRDPVYLDSPSIHLPAPPPDLTAATGAVVMDGRSSRRALTTALLDLASRGLLSFREESALLGLKKKVGIDVEPAEADAVAEAWRALNRRRPIGPAEKLAQARLARIAGTDGYVPPDRLLEFGTSVSAFDEKVEGQAVAGTWFRERPGKVAMRWLGRGTVFLVAGAIVLIIGIEGVPSQGIVLVGAAGIVSGIVLMVLSHWMPAVTRSGAMVRAQLAAYRRTLEKTMAQARSMQQVVDESGLEWLETPDQAVVWGTALGLQDEIEAVLARSLEDVRKGRPADSTYMPRWYTTAGGSAQGAGSGGSLMSSSVVPNFGAMMAVLGTIGNAPSSSGSGGGGFSGGSSGGGGGGAGGGF